MSGDIFEIQRVSFSLADKRIGRAVMVTKVEVRSVYE